MSGAETSSEPRGRAVLLAGGTGLVGGRCVHHLLADPTVDRLVLPGRRALPLPDPQRTDVRQEVVDFSRLGDHQELFRRVDQVFVCLGTTHAKAGSREAFRRVDFDFSLAVARAGSDAGARDLLLVSAVGADARSPFHYSRVKGELEEAVASLPYRSVHLFRPSLLLGERSENRPGERAATVAGRLLAPLLRGPLARYRPVEADRVARTMVALARAPGRGVSVHQGEALFAPAARERRDRR